MHVGNLLRKHLHNNTVIIERVVCDVFSFRVDFVKIRESILHFSDYLCRYERTESKTRKSIQVKTGMVKSSVL